MKSTARKSKDTKAKSYSLAIILNRLQNQRLYSSKASARLYFSIYRSRHPRFPSLLLSNWVLRSASECPARVIAFTTSQVRSFQVNRDKTRHRSNKRNIRRRIVNVLANVNRSENDHGSREEQELKYFFFSLFLFFPSLECNR